MKTQCSAPTVTSSASLRLGRRVHLALGLGLPLLAGCMTVTQQQWETTYSQNPVVVGANIAANVQVETAFAVAPEIKRSQNAAGFTAESVAAYEKGVAEALFLDIAHSGLFTSVSRQQANPDLILQIRAEQLPDRRLVINVAVLNPQTRESVLSWRGEHNRAYNTQMFAADDEYLTYMLHPQRFRGLLGDLKTTMAADLRSKDLSKLGGRFAVAAGGTGGPGAAKFEDLLVAKEANVPAARQRNRLLVSAKTLTVPQLLREKSTADLTALAVQLEQVMLDLNHEAALENDRAQRAAETAPRTVEEHRELAIAYKERIELLKPIGIAIKEEIANRGK